MERKRIFAISGVKNSGKTTLICKLLEIFKEKGLKVAVLKHDGHDLSLMYRERIHIVSFRRELTGQQFFRRGNICW